MQNMEEPATSLVDHGERQGRVSSTRGGLGSNCQLTEVADVLDPGVACTCSKQGISAHRHVLSIPPIVRF